MVWYFRSLLFIARPQPQVSLIERWEKALSSADKSHVVCIPCPFQSHIKSMLKLAKLLHHRGIHITFVNTEFNQTRFLRSSTICSDFSDPGFRFETIPDGLPPSDPDSNQDLVALFESTHHNFSGPFYDLVAKLNDMSSSSDAPSVSCIVSDVWLPFTVKVGEDLGGIPVAMFATISACSFMVYKHIPALLEKGLLPSNVEDKSLVKDGYIDWLPGMNGMRLKHLPPMPRPLMEWTVDLYNQVSKESSKANAIIFHTFDSLEQQVLNALAPMFPRIYTLGPLQLLLNQQIQQEESTLNSTSYGLWKEENECLKWLDSKSPNSVVYANFGSFISITKQQLIEFGMGLAKTSYPFLWVIRPDMVIGESSLLPPEFVEEIKHRGFIANWCPQEKVLNHPSIGCFVTHSGWNSTIESISAGVPMLCWPTGGDQPTNCKYTCDEWGIGMEIDEDVKRDGVERLVREMMETEKGMKMKERAMEWKKLAGEAASPNGSSSNNLDRLVKVLRKARGARTKE